MRWCGFPLQAAILDMEGMPIDQQRLIVCSRQLEDGRRLEEDDVSSGDTVQRRRPPACQLIMMKAGDESARQLKRARRVAISGLGECGSHHHVDMHHDSGRGQKYR